MAIKHEARAVDVQQIALDDKAAVDDQVGVGQVGGETVVLGANT
jgi:hypothetical protein